MRALDMYVAAVAVTTSSMGRCITPPIRSDPRGGPGEGVACSKVWSKSRTTASFLIFCRPVIVFSDTALLSS